MPVEVEEEEVTAEVREGPLKVMGTHVLYCDYGAGCTTVYTYQNSSNARFKRVDLIVCKLYRNKADFKKKRIETNIASWGNGSSGVHTPCSSRLRLP